jgi:hypothetical protein
VLHRRSAVLAAGGISPGFDSCDDWDLWARLARLGAPLRHHPVVVGEWRVHADNNSRNARRNLASGLKVLEAMHRSDPRVQSSAERWREGAPTGELTDWALRLLWLQVANCVARRDVDGAVGLVELFEEQVGTGHIRPESVVNIHGAMTFARLLAGDDPESYLPDLDADFQELFERLEARFEAPGFARLALQTLRDKNTRALIAENERLASVVKSYRTSRSYRIGRFLTRLARGRWPTAESG